MRRGSLLVWRDMVRLASKAGRCGRLAVFSDAAIQLEGAVQPAASAKNGQRNRHPDKGRARWAGAGPLHLEPQAKNHRRADSPLLCKGAAKLSGRQHRVMFLGDGE